MPKTAIHQKYKLLDGTSVPSVTTVLSILAKPALIHWAWELGTKGLDYRKVRDETANIGTLAHYLILCELRGGKPDTSEYSKEQIDQAENCLLSYYEWRKGHDLKPILIETPLVSDNGFGGMPDLLAVLDGRRILLDYKTGKSLYPEYSYQVGAYAHLLEDNGYKVEAARILRIGRTADETFEDYQVPDLKRAWDIFKCCLDFYQLTHKEGKHD